VLLVVDEQRCPMLLGQIEDIDAAQGQAAVACYRRGEGKK
jgi:hypothetical protein